MTIWERNDIKLAKHSGEEYISRRSECKELKRSMEKLQKEMCSRISNDEREDIGIWVKHTERFHITFRNKN